MMQNLFFSGFATACDPYGFTSQHAALIRIFGFGQTLPKIDPVILDSQSMKSDWLTTGEDIKTGIGIFEETVNLPLHS